MTKIIEGALNSIKSMPCSVVDLFEICYEHFNLKKNSQANIRVEQLLEIYVLKILLKFFISEKIFYKFLAFVAKFVIKMFI